MTTAFFTALDLVVDVVILNKGFLDNRNAHEALVSMGHIITFRKRTVTRI